MADKELLEALEYDLISLGLRLRWLNDGTDRLNLRDVYVILRQSPQSSAVFRCQEPEASLWTADSYLLANIFDVLAVANWQRQGDRHAPRPKQLRRPGDALPAISSSSSSDGVVGEGVVVNPMEADQSGQFVGEPTTFDELNEWLGWV